MRPHGEPIPLCHCNKVWVLLLSTGVTGAHTTHKRTHTLRDTEHDSVICLHGSVYLYVCARVLCMCFVCVAWGNATEAWDRVKALAIAPLSLRASVC